MRKALAWGGIAFGLAIIQFVNTLQHFSGDHRGDRRKTCLHCLTSPRASR